jgi:hypothetical protein
LIGLVAVSLLLVVQSDAAVNVTLNGVSYSIPEPGDTAWGQSLTDYLIATGSGLLQKSGGAFTLTGEVDFGNTFGLKSVYYKSRATNPATAGQFRLGNTEAIEWRNAANSGNLPLSVDSSNNLTYNGVPITSSSGIIPMTAGGTNAALTAANGAIPYSTASAFALLAPGTFGQVLASGGAGAPTWTTALTNPMTTAGDLILGGASGVPGRLAIGSNARVLTSNGTTASWQAPATNGTVTSVTFTGDGTVFSSTPSSAVTTTGTVTAALINQAKNTVLSGPSSGSNAAPTYRALVQADLPNVVGAGYFNGFFPSNSSNNWTTTSTTYIDATPVGTIPAITTLLSSGFGTVSGAASSLPGITFTAQRTGVIRIQFQVLIGTPGATLGGIRIFEAATSTTVATYISAGTNNQQVETLSGFFAVTASTAYTFKLQAKQTSGAFTFGNITTTTDAGLSVEMHYL